MTFLRIFKMASVFIRLWCTCLLLYLQESRGQQAQGSIQNAGFNNGMSLQQQAIQQMNAFNNIPNQNYNVPQQSNFQQGSSQQTYFPQGNSQQAMYQQGKNLQQLSMNGQGNSPQPFNLPTDFQPQSGSVPVSIQMVGPHKQVQSDMVMPNSQPGPFFGLGTISTPSASFPTNQFNEGGFKQNSQSYQLQQTAPPFLAQTLNTAPSFYPPTSPIADLRTLKNQPDLLSLIGSQTNIPWQQNQQNYVQTPMPSQNQLSDYQKQMLVRSLQPQPSIPLQTQQGYGYYQSQPLLGTVDIPQVGTLRNQPASLMQPIVTQLANPPVFIPVQPHPLTAYLQNQPFQTYAQNQPQHHGEEVQSLLSTMLSEFPPSSPQYALASACMAKKGSKLTLKTLIPHIINMIKEENNCSSRNWRCHNNCCNNNNCMEEPTIFSGYSNLRNYNHVNQECLELEDNDVDENTSTENERHNAVKADSREYSNEDEPDYVDDEET